MVAGFCTAYTGCFYNRISLAVYMGNLSFILQIHNALVDVTFVGLANYSKLLLDKTPAISFYS